MWPYVSLNGQESICFYITLLDSRFWAQLPSTCQEIAPEIGPVVWVAYKPPRRYESKWKRQRNSFSTSLYPPQACFCKNVLSASSDGFPEKVSKSRRIQNGSQCPFSLARSACMNKSQIPSLFFPFCNTASCFQSLSYCCKWLWLLVCLLSGSEWKSLNFTDLGTKMNRIMRWLSL